MDATWDKAPKLAVATSAKQVKILDSQSGSLSDTLELEQRVSKVRFAINSDRYAIFAYQRDQGKQRAAVYDL